MADEIFLDNLNSTPVSEIKFLNEEWAYIVDTNNGSYTSNQITFNTQNLASNDAYFLWSEAVIVLPTVTQLSVVNKQAGAANVAVALTRVDYALVPKSGSHNWVNQIQVQADGKTLPSTFVGVNEVANAKLLMETSSAGLQKNGSLRNFYPDTSNSWSYNTGVIGAKVQGYANNRIKNNLTVTAFDSTFESALINEGLQKRGNYMCDAAVNVNTTAVLGTAINAAQVCRNSTVFDATGNTALYSINNVCIPLKDMSEFHKHLDFPIKSLAQELRLSVNSGTYMCTALQPTAAAASFTTIQATSSSNGSATTCPMMITDAFLESLKTNFISGATVLVDNIYNVNMNCSIATALTTVGGITVSPHLSQCRIYVPYVKFDPHLIPADKQKRVKYLDYTPAILTNIGGAGSPNLNFTISNNVHNLKRVFMLCYISGAVASHKLAPLLSPFADGKPQATWMSNEVLSLNNVPFSRQPVNYLFENYLKELKQASVNGGIDDVICAGLLNSTDHASAYSGLKVWDVSRNQNFAIVSSVQVSYSGVMQSLLPIDVHFFLECEKERIVDLQTGAIVQG